MWLLCGIQLRGRETYWLEGLEGEAMADRDLERFAEGALRQRWESKMACVRYNTMILGSVASVDNFFSALQRRAV